LAGLVRQAAGLAPARPHPAVIQYLRFRRHAFVIISTAMETMDIEQSPSQAAGVTIFTLKGPFTLGTMFAFQSALREPAVQGAIIDLSNVPYMDSAGLGVLLGQFSHSQRNRQKFALAGVSERVMTIFRITHTDSVLPIFSTVAEAEARFSV
jgi:anti-sigma B factor antagonist